MLLEYFNGDELAASAWKGKYAIEGEETPDDMHGRMALEFARIEKRYTKLERHPDLSRYGKVRPDLSFESIYDFFRYFKYIVPQGSIMAMLGNRHKIGSLANCFVVGQPHDSYGGILEKDEQLVQLMKRRGGVGIDISSLRPSSAPVSNAAGSSTGAASFMHRYSNSTREVAQKGRRGALMITIDVRHPDIFEFVNMKKDRQSVTGANISVMLRDDFMQAVVEDSDYILRFPCDREFSDIGLETMSEIYEYNVLNKYEVEPDKFVFLKRIKARELYDQIVENAWDNAEPGQMFLDRHWDYSPDGVYDDYRGVTTNPCGEIFMGAYDSCRLFALNLLSIVKNPFTPQADIDYDLLYVIAYEQQRLADDLVDLELEHIERIINKIKKSDEPCTSTELNLWENIKYICIAARRTGCGFTGLADMLAALGLPYDSDEAITLIDKIFKIKLEAELECSIDLAIERGPFIGWDKQKEKV